MRLGIFAMVFGLTAATAQAEVRNYDCDLHSIQAQ
jgi:hypothetical protein